MANAHRKTPTNLSLRDDLVRRAKQLGLNLSDIVENALAEAVRRAEREAWEADNREAIDDYNKRVANHGVFSDEWRRF